MIGYITLGSKDLSASAVFFDALLEALGGTRAYTLDNMIAWGFGPTCPMIIAAIPQDGQTATAGNGTMVALMASDRAQVDTVHSLALKLGGTDEGPPGPRGDRYYGGYFRDLDGNKFSVFIMS